MHLTSLKNIWLSKNSRSYLFLHLSQWTLLFYCFFIVFFLFPRFVSPFPRRICSFTSLSKYSLPISFPTPRFPPPSLPRSFHALKLLPRPFHALRPPAKPPSRPRTPVTTFRPCRFPAEEVSVAHKWEGGGQVDKYSFSSIISQRQRVDMWPGYSCLALHNSVAFCIIFRSWKFLLICLREGMRQSWLLFSIILLHFGKRRCCEDIKELL